MSKVVVVGGGAAGMMAAVAAAENGHTVTLLEKNEKLGKKVYITGKGRCNLTNNCEVEELLAAVCVNRKFLYSAFYGFTSQDTIDFFEQSGMHTKTERGCHRSVIRETEKERREGDAACRGKGASDGSTARSADRL